MAEMGESHSGTDGGVDRPEGRQVPVLLLLGVVAGAILSFIVAIFRRPPARPSAEAALETATRPETPPTPTTGAGHVSVVRVAETATGTSAPPGSTRWPTATKYVVGVGLCLAVLAILYFSRSVIPTVVLAALVAFIVSPLVRFNQQRLKLKRGLAVAFAYLLVIIVLLLVPLVLLPAIVNAVNSFVTVDYQTAADSVVGWVEEVAATVAQVPVLNAILQPLLDALLQSLEAISSAQAPAPVSYPLTVAEAGGTLAEMVGRLASVLGPVVGAVTSLVFMVLISIYMSLSTDQIRGWYPKLVPPGYEPEVAGVFRRIGGLWSGYLRGELTLMVLIGTVVWLGNSVLGNANALLLGVISGFMELIPNIGPAIALIPGVLMALLFGSSHLAVSNLAFALIVLAFYLLVQALENQFVVPYVMGDAVDLPPLVVLIGTFVGAATVGILGALLATPVIATGKEVFGYLYNKILEPPPDLGPAEAKPDLLQTVTGAVKNLAQRIRLPSGVTQRLRGRPKQGAAPEKSGLAVAPGGSEATPMGLTPAGGAAAASAPGTKAAVGEAGTG